jgi:hypothetical protein
MHPSIRPYLEYFSLPKGYGPPGLGWAATGEALETHDGTYRFTQQIADFLDGFASVRPVPHFAHVLECLELLGSRPPAACPEPERFRVVAATFRQLGSPMRNAGALFGHLCAAVPPAVRVPPGGGKSLAHWLTHSPSLGFLHAGAPGNPEVPGLAAHAFHERVTARLRPLTDFEVRHWLRHGIAPQDLPGEQLARELEQKPPSIGEFLDLAIQERTRMGASLPLVRHFVSALSLPPRKHTPPQLPIGGYADVTARGDPARLLPSQFALDPDEFVRRFAEHELLYFRREDPHERRKEHLALVVDQGVLTWGPVRLALGAAVLAFGRLAARRGLTFSVRCGSAPAERFMPPAGDPERFGDVLEASDLNPHPGHALAEEVLDPGAPERDIVLLTHPRVLREGEVQRLAKVPAPGCRLFALSVTEDGQVELARLSESGAVPVSRFRVEFTAPVPATPKPTAVEAPPQAPWSGDIEPIPFPFRFGLTNRVIELAFDAAGERLTALTVHGMLHVWTLADGTVEVLPRGASEGQVVKDVQQVMGVENGFVVGGRLGSALVVVHYDWPTRTVTLHTLFSDGNLPGVAFHAFPHLHAVAVKAGSECRAIDLGTGARYPDPFPARGANSRAQMAAAEAQQLELQRPRLPSRDLGLASIDLNRVKPPAGPFVSLEPGAGRVRVDLEQKFIAFVPTSDGRPRLKGVKLFESQHAGNTLAILAGNYFPAQKTWSLHDLGEDGRTLGEYPTQSKWERVARLSPDGELFARQTGSGVLTVTAPADGRTLLVTEPGRCHSNLDVRLGYRCLGIGLGPRGCLLDWTAGPLRVRDDVAPADDFGRRATNRLYRGQGVFAPTTGRFAGMFRFTHWEVGLDIFGQIAIVRDGVVACMFTYRRGNLAARSPDGVRYGPPDLTGGPESPGALDRLGEILRQATK